MANALAQNGIALISVCGFTLHSVFIYWLVRRLKQGNPARKYKTKIEQAVNAFMDRIERDSVKPGRVRLASQEGAQPSESSESVEEQTKRPSAGEGGKTEQLPMSLTSTTDETVLNTS